MNFGAGVLTFREGLEAALILAIMLGYLRKVGRADRQLAVWAGALSAAGLALGFTLLLQLFGAEFDYPAKGIYEGLTSLLAVGMLTYMIIWMSRQGRYIKGALEQSMKKTVMRGAAWGLFGIAFLTVAREGVETALLLSASAFASSGTATLIGGIVGLVASLLLAWGVYLAGARLNYRTFFRVTSVLLVIFAAAILRYSIQEFEEVGWLPPIIENVWNTGSWLPVGSTLGAVLQTLVGYTSKPSLLQVVGYVGYLVVVGVIMFRPAPKVAAAPQPVTAQQPEKTEGEAKTPQEQIPA